MSAPSSHPDQDPEPPPPTGDSSAARDLLRGLGTGREMRAILGADRDAVERALRLTQLDIIELRRRLKDLELLTRAGRNLMDVVDLWIPWPPMPAPPRPPTLHEAIVTVL